MSRLETVLSKRCLNVMFLYENPVNPSNVYACLRTMDAFGVQDVAVVDPGYKRVEGETGGKGEADCEEIQGDDTQQMTDNNNNNNNKKKKKKSKHSAMGSDKWMTLHRYKTGSSEGGIESVVKDLKSQGYTIYSSSLEGGVDIRDLEFVSVRGGEVVSGSGDDAECDCVGVESGKNLICVAFGNEESGISPTLLSLSDSVFYLPMYGFAESFNLSVATSLTLAYLQGKGVVKESKGDVWKGRKREIMTRWMLNSLPKKGMGEKILKRSGIDVTYESSS